MSAPDPYPPGQADPATIAEFDARFRAPLMAYFTRRVNIAADAEDMVQETFARLAKPGRIEAIQNVEAYIFQVAQTLILERARWRKSRNANEDIPLDETHPDEGVLSAERIVEGKDTVQRLLTALKELPERTRTIFILQRFEGLTYVEVAKQLGLHPSTVEKNMGRAIAHIANRMADDV
jgi:RNA polymerase sigma factor (sigma-70 family)